MQEFPVAAYQGRLDFDARPAAGRVGMLLLDSDLTTEADMAWATRDTGIVTHGARLGFGGETTTETLRATLPKLGAAAALLPPDEHLDAIGFACTAAIAVLGEQSVTKAIHATRPGVPVCTPFGAARRALAAAGVRRLAILAPYAEGPARALAGAFAAAGFELCAVTALGIADDRQMARLTPGSIEAAALAVTPPEAEALFISCTALRAAPMVARLEAALGRRVITANQALLWACLRAAGYQGGPLEAGWLMTQPWPEGMA
jgi:maleate isomerase